MKLVLPAILLICFLLSSSFLQSTLAGSGYCDAKCKNRCAKAGVSDRCIKYCGCKCVSSGTYGNIHNRDKLNSKGSPKCLEPPSSFFSLYIQTPLPSGC
ncbi:hypothetical protein ACHQM5_016017 [Ranunculus cassubicifolius]